MFKKNVVNLVFYKNSAGEKQATVFYDDGTVKPVSFDEGIDFCEEIVKERNIQTKDAFKEMINHDIVHVVSENEFLNNFQNYISKKPVYSDEPEEIVVPFDNPEDENTAAIPSGDVEEEEEDRELDPVLDDTPEAEEEEEEDKGLDPVLDDTPEEELAPVADEEEEDLTDTGDTSDEEVEEEEEEKEGFLRRVWNKIKGYVKAIAVVAGVLGIVVGINSCSKRKSLEGWMYRSNLNTPKSNTEIDNSKHNNIKLISTDGDIKLLSDDDIQLSSEDDDTKLSSEDDDKKLVSEDDDTKLVSEDADKKLVSEDADKKLVSEDDDTKLVSDTNVQNQINQDNTVKRKTFLNDTIISHLLNITTNPTQKTAMTNLSAAMDAFNNDFADHYVEEGKDIRPALKFEEVVALQVAYNDYSKEELQAYFNGADIRAGDLQRAYKDASLQLMGAYAIENSEHPVDMSMLIEDDLGKDFYRMYHEMFLKAKEATGEDKIRLVTEFYNAVRRDFPVSQELRTEGISHSQNYETLDAYKLSVTPMIAAAEMMWQNLDVDVTLDDMEVDFLNDLGLCNYADKSFERAETIALSHDADSSNPTYDDYKAAFERYFTRLGTYYIDDEHRELTKLDSFQNAVNWHFETDGWVRDGDTVVSVTESHDETYSWTENETTYREEITETPKPITDSAKQEVDEQIEKENEEAKQQAEAAAEAERQRLQQEADKHTSEVEEEVKQDEGDLQDRINQANNQINHNNADHDPTNDKPVNEDDLGHGVDFDDDHSNSQGDLDPSVENITTDSTGDMTNEPLPDPNVTGKDFDAAGDLLPSKSVEIVEDEDLVDVEEEEVEWVESVPVDDDTYYEDAWVEYDSDELYVDAIEAYVEAMADSAETDEYQSGYQYQR